MAIVAKQSGKAKEKYKKHQMLVHLLKKKQKSNIRKKVIQNREKLIIICFCVKLLYFVSKREERKIYTQTQLWYINEEIEPIASDEFILQ